ncbi:MAG TPA: class I SAM-dependent methyltransferase [Nocardioides sp.]|jgi:trans-aconitate methyltransferase|nr:class I SAM-dependent methyltransferase [Nocardioides sp.]
MTSEPVRAGAGWLALREPADAAARSTALVEELCPYLADDRVTRVHDLGCGTGSMARWLAPRLSGPQHWVLHDRDAELLPLAEADPPRGSSDGAPVSVETRHDDITRLDPSELADASLVTASALLDMLTADELDRLVHHCASTGSPLLLALSVTGRVDLAPADPSDEPFTAAFNEHQRRASAIGLRLGPDALEAAVERFTGLGREVEVRASPWRLGPDSTQLTREWLAGWVGAACDQRPELDRLRPSYVERRLAELDQGRLTVTVHHQDLLVRPA